MARERQIYRGTSGSTHRNPRFINIFSKTRTKPNGSMSFVIQIVGFKMVIRHHDTCCLAHEQACEPRWRVAPNAPFRNQTSRCRKLDVESTILNMICGMCTSIYVKKHFQEPKILFQIRPSYANARLGALLYYLRTSACAAPRYDRSQ